MPQKQAPITGLICSCCDGHLRGRQWHNRDIGYGLCNRCADNLEVKLPPEEMASNYGVKGVHYLAWMEYSEIRWAAEESKTAEELSKVVEKADRLYLAGVLQMADDEWKDFTHLVRVKASIPLVPTLEATIQRMKTEILADVRAGRVPKDVSSFSQLHDFVDANEYGGLCEDRLSALLIVHFGGRDSNEGLPDGLVRYSNDAMNSVAKWIVDGGIPAALDS